MKKSRIVLQKPKPGVQFGGSVERFNYYGVHPSLLTTTMTRDAKRDNLAPGSYDIKDINAVFKKYANSANSWSKQLESEEFSRYLGYRFRHIAEERKNYRVNQSVGNPNLDMSEYKKKVFSTLVGGTFGTSERFPDAKFNTLANYPKDILKSSCILKKSSSKLPTMEYDMTERFPDEKVRTVPPNYYSAKHPKSIDTFLDKKVSHLHTMYETFTLPRDDTSYQNHFRASSKPLDVYYDVMSDIDYLLQHKNRSKYGRFLKCERNPKQCGVRVYLKDLSMAYKRPEDPGPADYDNEPFIGAKKHSKRTKPFNMTSKSVSDYVWTTLPGPGRYFCKDVTCKGGKKESHVFKNRMPRPMNVVTEIDMLCN